MYCLAYWQPPIFVLALSSNAGQGTGDVWQQDWSRLFNCAATHSRLYSCSDPHALLYASSPTHCLQGGITSYCWRCRVASSLLLFSKPLTSACVRPLQPTACRGEQPAAAGDAEQHGDFTGCGVWQLHRSNGGCFVRCSAAAATNPPDRLLLSVLSGRAVQILKILPIPAVATCLPPPTCCRKCHGPTA